MLRIFFWLYVCTILAKCSCQSIIKNQFKFFLHSSFNISNELIYQECIQEASGSGDVTKGSNLMKVIYYYI